MPTPISAERFGSLNLRDDPSEVGWGGAVEGATDLHNVDFERGGRVRSRPGSTKLNSGAFTAGTAQRVFEWAAAGAAPLRYSLSGTTVTIDLLDPTSGVVSAAWSGWASGGTYFSHAAIGSSGTFYLFVAQQAPGSSPLVRRIDSAGTDAASVGSCYWVAVWQDRLVQANIETAPAGAVTGSDVVFFSGPGTPETFDATDFLRVGAGDGEAIHGMVAWRELLFVVKETRMFVFYAIGTDATGGAIFNYRTVDLPARFESNTAENVNSVVAGPDGVYLALVDGIYVSAGGVPVEVSQVVRPLFEKTASASLRRDSQVSLDYVGGRIFARYTNDSASATRTLVYHPVHKTWTIWGLGSVVNLLEHRQYDGGHVVYWADQTNVYELDDDVATDNGTAIASHYQTGFQALADGRSARVRRFELTGSGTVTHTLYGDHSTASEWTGTAATSVAMGAAPAVERKYALQSGRARNLAFKVSAASGAWSLSRWAAQIADVRSY